MKKSKKKNEQENYAFIDGQNLYLAITESGWKLDYERFRRYLKEKYHIKTAYMFMGFLPDNQKLYSFLQRAGFILIFKPILEVKQKQKVKGNCDAELVLQAMIDYKAYDKALIVTGDGDFQCLVRYLEDNGKLYRVLAPSPKNCSVLLRKVAKNKLVFASQLKNKLEYKKKEPHKDGTS